jgi:hypothetical protein
MLRPGPQPTRVALSQRASRRLWVVAVLDMTAVAWMIAIGNWLDQTSRLTAVITLGGHHLLVLIMALVSFLMLAAAALLTDGFTSANKLGITLITVACISQSSLSPVRCHSSCCLRLAPCCSASWLD